MLRKSTITLYLAIGLTIALMISKQVQDNMLDKISVISAIGIDKSKKGYIVTLQKYNPAATSKEGAAELGSYTYSAHGRTIPEAIDRIQNKFSRTIFLESVEVAVLGESLVKSEGINALADYFLRESNLPSNIRWVISKGVKPDKLLQIIMPIQKVSGTRFEEMLNRKRESWGNLSDMTADKIKGMVLQNRTELTIPYITKIGRTSKGISKSNIEKASPDMTVEIEGLAVFQHQRFSYWLSSQESNLYALTRTKIQDTTMVTKCRKQSGYVTWKDMRSKSVIHLLDKKGVPSFLLQVQIKAEVSDVSCKMDTSTVQAIAQLEHDAEHDLQNQINHLIKKTQNKKTDIDGFGETLYRKQPDRWDRVKNDWDSVYSTVPIRIRVRVDLIEPGEFSSQ
ncbi:Ger(x)C family spore germination protein [Bacillus sp. sid0103]|uniref:Ger(x)C family spore germination protein n=1 Tax=Bacillus sp. sid0103 TaxID=2856337 RepID=UPI001C4408B6|nr:Ger(x)C family spore germination protein [Bacillus sp. sid0103]MBV7508683.1 Ger(x)C family spore germination protein [Bacillus sp. sid0103]